ncbi:hypothetical protein ACFU6S_29490 [Streptomyces sp. NPDC057456]|uniref:hypothetical protein n=1 Tax=Streptomyces sp. NPDC057456 TaxID=3346139 RepID=UPI0036B473F0
MTSSYGTSLSQGANSGSSESVRRLSLTERLALVYERLDELRPPKTAEEALQQLNSTLEEVEDEFSGVPKNPNPGLKFDGRMYPPRDDFINRDSDGGITAVTKGNIVQIWADGSMVIRQRITGEENYRRGWPPVEE